MAGRSQARPGKERRRSSAGARALCPRAWSTPKRPPQALAAPEGPFPLPRDCARHSAASWATTGDCRHVTFPGPAQTRSVSLTDRHTFPSTRPVTREATRSQAPGPGACGRWVSTTVPEAQRPGLPAQASALLSCGQPLPAASAPHSGSPEEDLVWTLASLQWPGHSSPLKTPPFSPPPSPRVTR